jgi:hypothetical protein
MTDANLPENQDKDENQENQEPETPEDGNQTFKTFEDAMTGYKSLQGVYTKETQENKAMREEMTQLKEQMQLMQMSGSQPAQQQQAQDFETQYIHNPEDAINNKVAEGVRQAQIAGALDELSLENPGEYQERYAYADRLAAQYPQLKSTPAGIKKLFAMGDKFRKEDQLANAQKSVSLLLGEDVDMEKFKKLVAKDPGQQQNTNNAYMPDTTQSTGPTPDPESETIRAKAVQEGDVDTVLQELFKDVLKE